MHRALRGGSPLPMQSVFAWGKFHAFCKMHRRRECSLLMAKENQKTTSDFDALEPRTRGYSPLVTPKLFGSIQKIQVAALEDFFVFRRFRAPLSRCATAPHGGADTPASFAIQPEIFLPQLKPPPVEGRWLRTQ